MRLRTNRKRLVNAKAHALIKTMSGNLEELNAETLNDTPGIVKPEVVAERMADTQGEVQA